MILTALLVALFFVSGIGCAFIGFLAGVSYASVELTADVNEPDTVS